MDERNKDVELYERVAILETQYKEIGCKLDTALDILDNGLKENIAHLTRSFEDHCKAANKKEVARLESKKFWMIFIRSMMVGTFLAAVGILLESLLR